MNIDNLIHKALDFGSLTIGEGTFLYKNTPTSTLIYVANEMRKKLHPQNKVGWIIDRNVNISNVCAVQCKFCNFYRNINSPEAYVTSLEEYKQKIEELYKLDGDQLLLQGGCHPKLGIDFYTKLFSDLKSMFPDLKLHALGPAEIHHISKLEKLSYKCVLEKLMEAGLDSLPGAGAEILVDRVRKIVSRAKCSAKQWLDVMHEAHKLNMTTSATMMFGHVETKQERIEHLVAIREYQDKKPNNSEGFTTFILWPFMDKGTNLNIELGIKNSVTSEEYIRSVAISRIMLPNIKNIQASWLTVGKDTGQIALHAGANDFGSIMIEENVVSAAGANYKFDAEGIQKAIKEAGFIPYRRNQKYEVFQNK